MKDKKIFLDILTNTNSYQNSIKISEDLTNTVSILTSIVLYPKFVIEVKQDFTIINKPYKRKLKVNSITS